jgi:hypothetical protein
LQQDSRGRFNDLDFHCNKIYYTKKASKVLLPLLAKIRVCCNASVVVVNAAVGGFVPGANPAIVSYNASVVKI